MNEFVARRSVVRRLVRGHGQRLRCRCHGRPADRGGRCGVGRGRGGRRAGAGRHARGVASLRRAGRRRPHQQPHRPRPALGRDPRPRQAPAHLVRRQPATGWLRRSTCAAAIASRSPIGKRRPTRRRRGCAAISKCCRRSRRRACSGRQGHLAGRHRRHRDDAGGMLRRRRDHRRRSMPRPDGVALERWLQTFPSYGYLLAVAPAKVAAVIEQFERARHRRRRDRRNRGGAARRHHRRAGNARPCGISRASR